MRYRLSFQLDHSTYDHGSRAIGIDIGYTPDHEMNRIIFHFIISYGGAWVCWNIKLLRAYR